MIKPEPISADKPKCPTCGVMFLPEWTKCEACAGTARGILIETTRKAPIDSPPSPRFNRDGG